MRKTRSDKKSISLPLAMKLYWEGGSLKSVAEVFCIHHTNLMNRFHRNGIPTKTKSEAMKKHPKLVARVGPKNHNWRGGSNCL